ncbi:MAG: hypothetical protein WD250_15450 [Egibacteraceae bacterium]
MSDETDPTQGAADAERVAVARWVATWQRAGTELEEHRRSRLAAMTLSEMRRAIGAIFVGSPPLPPRRSSGLVEMQRLLSRLP